MLQLNFKKGQYITLTQREEGGWWEGTLDGKTGWFPTNYVQEDSSFKMAAAHNGSPLPAEISKKRVEFRQQVIRDLLDKEKEFVADLVNLEKKYLGAIRQSET